MAAAVQPRVRLRLVAAAGTPDGRTAPASEQQQQQQQGQQKREQDIQQQQREQEGRRDPRLAAAAAAALVAVGAAAYSILSSQPQLPPVQEVLGPAAAVALGGPALGLAAAKALLGDMFHVELHRWVGWAALGAGGVWESGQQAAPARCCPPAASACPARRALALPTACCLLL